MWSDIRERADDPSRERDDVEVWEAVRRVWDERRWWKDAELSWSKKIKKYSQ